MNSDNNAVKIICTILFIVFVPLALIIGFIYAGLHWFVHSNLHVNIKKFINDNRYKIKDDRMAEYYLFYRPPFKVKFARVPYSAEGTKRLRRASKVWNARATERDQKGYN